MEKYLSRLKAEELEPLARIRMAVTVELIAQAAASDAGISALAGRKPFLLALRAPGLPPAFLRSGGGIVQAFSGGARPPAGAASLSLRFPSKRLAARVLGGSGGAVIPVPRGPGALAALGFFRSASREAPALLKAGSSPELRARLLTAVALRGLVETANADPWLADRIAHIPDGAAAVELPGVFAYCVEKRGPLFSFRDRVPEKPEARLQFKDAESAIAVLSGSRQAVVALGAGELRLRGLLPLIQGLFAVLDRLGAYLAVTID